MMRMTFFTLGKRLTNLALRVSDGRMKEIHLHAWRKDDGTYAVEFSALDDKGAVSWR